VTEPGDHGELTQPDRPTVEPVPDPAERPVPAWRRPTRGENRIAVAVAILAAAALQLFLSQQFTLIHPRWLLPALEVALLASLTVINPLHMDRHTPLGRNLGLLLVAIISVDNGISAVLLDTKLIGGTAGNDAGPLLASAASIYLTNIIAFGIWYWELDRDGPLARAAALSPHPDFLFPQMTQEHLVSEHWEPHFGDYLYVSFTNATAFSPTDTMPLTRGVKFLMALQSARSPYPPPPWSSPAPSTSSNKATEPALSTRCASRAHRW